MKKITNEDNERLLMINGNDVGTDDLFFIYLNYFIRNNCKRKPRYFDH